MSLTSESLEWFSRGLKDAHYATTSLSPDPREYTKPGLIRSGPFLRQPGFLR